MNKIKIKLLSYILAATSVLATSCAEQEITPKYDFTIETLVNDTEGEVDITTPSIPLDTTPSVPLDTTPSIPLDTTPSVPLDTTPSIPLDTTPSVPLDTTPSVPEETTPSVPEETTPSMGETEITKESTNIIVSPTKTVSVYAGNTVDALKIGSFKIGESAYRILSCNNGWDLIKTDNYIGYVSSDSLKYVSDTSKDSYEHELKKDIVLTTNKLNFRKGPNTSYEKIEMFPENTELQVLAKTNNDWYLVNYNGVLGYVSSEYTISILEKIQKEYPNLELSELEVKKVVYSNATKLNMRNGNSTNDDIIDSLTRYETTRVLKELEDWYLVLTNDYNLGYINKSYTKDLEDKCVIVDLSEQQLWLYNNNQLWLTTPVTTGKDSTPSDIGLFKINSKQEDRYLTGPGYKSWVEYWMPYNGGEGLHDDSWRNVFGTDSYHKEGSHGCINIPPEIADDVYNNVKVGTKVLVHK